MNKNINIPKLIIGVVYKSKDGTWRGFCSPFDISCTAKTAKQAMKITDSLVKAYIDGLCKYDFPLNTAVKELSDEEDKIVFKKVREYVIKDIARKMTENLKRFQTESKINTFEIKDDIKASGQYSFLSTNLPSFAGC